MTSTGTSHRTRRVINNSVTDESILSVRWAAGPDVTTRELESLLRLRVRVFVVEQSCPYQEVDGRDLESRTRHLWLSDGAQPLAYLRMLSQPDGTVRIGRVCTVPHARGRGLAGRLMTEAVANVGGAECVLNAQVYVRDFYARFGFRPEGREFLDDGIPHIRMRRPASARTG